MASTPIKTVVGNTAPNFVLTAERDGVVINLTGCSVALIIARNGTVTNAGHQACVVTNAAGGVVSYAPQSGDFPNKGNYKGDLKITYGDGTSEILYDNARFKVRSHL